jgi:hypothetical protein
MNSVILASRITQNNSNHLLGFRGMRTWPCVDATQAVIFSWVLIVLGSLLLSFRRNTMTVLPL